MDSTISLARSAASAAGTAPQLFVALHGHAPLTAPSRHVLGALDRVVIGRGNARATRAGRVLTIGLPDRAVSSTHAALVRVQDGWLLEDQASKNGTRLNGAAARRGALVDGDVVQAGSTALIFRDRVRPVRPEVMDLDGARAETFSAAMDDALEAIERVAPALLSIVLLGATGTGKEVLARRLHERSGRAGRFVAVNCAAIPRELVESTLFGHRRGAFSGAVEDRPGFVRAADGGTLFLDEIADLPAPAQAALLRVLQEREVVPVGDTKPIAVDLRVVAAAQAPLAEIPGFRADLLARVSGLTIKIPALAERKEDLGFLVGALLPRVGGKHAVLTADAVAALLANEWKLNVRELEQCLAAAVALGGGELDAKHLGAIASTTTGGEPGAPPDATLVELTAQLAEHRGNLSAVARAMGKGRTQIQRWLKRYHLDPASFRR